MNINISGDQDKMSAPARQALPATKYIIRCNRPSDNTPQHCRQVRKDCVTQIMKLEYIFEMHSFSTDLEDKSVHRSNHSHQRKMLHRFETNVFCNVTDLSHSI